MSRRRNGTNRAASQLGINYYNPGNKNKKKAVEAATSYGTQKKTNNQILTQDSEKVKYIALANKIVSLYMQNKQLCENHDYDNEDIWIGDCFGEVFLIIRGIEKLANALGLELEVRNSILGKAEYKYIYYFTYRGIEFKQMQQELLENVATKERGIE